MARPATQKPSLLRGLRQALAGLLALACLTALFFSLLRWRANTPELHLNFGGGAHNQPAGASGE
jgi:hypothetical protein